MSGILSHPEYPGAREKKKSFPYDQISRPKGQARPKQWAVTAHVLSAADPFLPYLSENPPLKTRISSVVPRKHHTLVVGCCLQQSHASRHHQKAVHPTRDRKKTLHIFLVCAPYEASAVGGWTTGMVASPPARADPGDGLVCSAITHTCNVHKEKGGEREQHLHLSNYYYYQ